MDHVLAAAGLGLWLGLQQCTRRSIPLYFAALVAGLVLAGLWIGASGGISGIEWMLAATLIVAGLLLYNALPLPRVLTAGVITAVFCCHFCAHILAMPAAPGAVVASLYAGGLFIGTVSMLAVAAVAGVAAVRGGAPAWWRLAGATIAAAGVATLGLACGHGRARGGDAGAAARRRLARAARTGFRQTHG
jgi:hypothetical protein